MRTTSGDANDDDDDRAPLDMDDGRRLMMMAMTKESGFSPR